LTATLMSVDGMSSALTFICASWYLGSGRMAAKGFKAAAIVNEGCRRSLTPTKILETEFG